MPLTEDLAALDSIDYSNVVDAPVDENYPESLPIAPVPEGNYRLRITKWELDRDRATGALRFANDDATGEPTWPTIVIQQSAIVEPTEHAVGWNNGPSYENVRTKPFMRPKGSNTPASNFGDMFRAFDQTRGYDHIKQGIAIFAEMAASGTMKVRLKWEGYDKDYVEARFAEVGGKNMASKEEANAIYNEGRLKGMKNFPQNPDGSYAGAAPSKQPGGALVKARLVIAEFHGSAKPIKGL